MKIIFLSFYLFVGFVNADMIRIDQNEVVIDTRSKTMWQDNSDVERVKKDWQGAIGYCENLVHLGYDDWRLPIIDQFFSIRDEKRKNIAINTTFKKVVSDNYWSSSDVYGSKHAWSINFENGDDAVSPKDLNFYVRCIRDNQ